MLRKQRGPGFAATRKRKSKSNSNGKNSSNRRNNGNRSSNPKGKNNRMAIVHVSYKSSSQAPPAQYLARDGQYEKRGGLELIESGNMPEFAQTNPQELLETQAVLRKEAGELQAMLRKEAAGLEALHQDV